MSKLYLCALVLNTGCDRRYCEVLSKGECFCTTNKNFTIYPDIDISDCESYSDALAKCTNSVQKKMKGANKWNR